MGWGWYGSGGNEELYMTRCKVDNEKFIEEKKYTNRVLPKLPDSTQLRGYDEHKLKVNASTNFCHFRPKQDDLEMYVVCPEIESKN